MPKMLGTPPPVVCRTHESLFDDLVEAAEAHAQRKQDDGFDGRTTFDAVRWAFIMGAVWDSKRKKRKRRYGPSPAIVVTP